MKLQALRLNKGLTTREAALKIGVSRETLRRAEMGFRPHPGKAKKIADFYGERVTDLWPLTPPEREAA